MVIAVKELEYVLERSTGGANATVQEERQKNIVKTAMNILMRCDYEPSIRDFITACALDSRKPPLDTSILTSVAEFALNRNYISLTEACFRLERAHYELKLPDFIVSKYGGSSASQTNFLLD